MSKWKVRTLRLTLFGTPEGAGKAAVLPWEAVVGTKPESTVTRGDVHVQEGPLPPGRLVLQNQPGRLDVLFAGFPQADKAEEPVATLGEFESASMTFREIARKVVDRSGPTVRLALGAEMVQAAESAIAAYHILVDHMQSATFKFEGGQEFVYQINRPRRSKVIPDISVNRLARWNASSWQPVTFELGAGVRVLSGAAHVGALLTTDVNTEGERTVPLPTGELLELFDELRDLTLEIRDKGDIS